MRSNHKNPVLMLLAVVILLQLCWLFKAEAFDSFSGEINADAINVRVDSTITAEIISKVNKNDKVIVVFEGYDWYKIKLPKNSPAFVKKDLLVNIDAKTAKALKDKINVRLRPTESSPIVGRIDDKDETIHIIEDSGEWYKIAPVNNSFGWIHKKFVDKVIKPVIPPPVQEQSAKDVIVQQSAEQGSPAQAVEISGDKLKTDVPVIVEGIIEPYGKFWKRKATHKLVTSDNKVFLLKGSKDQLKAFTRQKVRITGKLIADEKQKYPVIEILNMENLTPALQP
ncbi:MAG: SH3 domain-containing protein [Candidatus Omnitrophota bacterium]